jgi:hypothetical protein
MLCRLLEAEEGFDAAAIVRFPPKNHVAAEGSKPVAPVSDIIVLPPGVKLNEFGAFRFSPPASEEENPIDDDTPPGSGPR